MMGLEELAEASKKMAEFKLTRRQYLAMQAMMDGAGPILAIEAVATTALEHPEWDMNETKTLAEWEKGGTQ